MGKAHIHAHLQMRAHALLLFSCFQLGRNKIACVQSTMYIARPCTLADCALVTRLEIEALVANPLLKQSRCCSSIAMGSPRRRAAQQPIGWRATAHGAASGFGVASGRGTFAGRCTRCRLPSPRRQRPARQSSGSGGRKRNIAEAARDWSVA